MYEDFSQKTLAEVLSVFTKKDYAFVYNDVLGNDGRKIDPLSRDHVRSRLTEAGYLDLMERQL